jgi:dTDP-4-dehydrorhamnose reductase
MVILVTGASGQVGQAIKAAAPAYSDIRFYFAGSDEADITNLQSLEAVFNRINPNVCINAAAYTAVDKAESEPEKAHAINVTGVKNLAEVCKAFRTVLIHISTDFVFDGTKRTPYTEEDATNPQSVYGKTKLEGEKAIRTILTEYYIIRTSWVYSQYGNNFMKTMLRLAGERNSLSVVNDQTGTPTNANSLAKALIAIAVFCKNNASNAKYGLYHYSDEGQCSWYDFAKKIFEVNKITIDLHAICTVDYPTPAKRPLYSVLSKEKIKNAFGISIPNWQEVLTNIKI